MIQIVSIRDEIDLTSPGGARRLKLLLRRGSRTFELPVSAEQAGIIIQLSEEVSTDPTDTEAVPRGAGLTLASVQGGRKRTAPQEDEDEPIRFSSPHNLGTYVDEGDDL